MTAAMVRSGRTQRTQPTVGLANRNRQPGVQPGHEADIRGTQLPGDGCRPMAAIIDPAASSSFGDGRRARPCGHRPPQAATLTGRPSRRCRSTAATATAPAFTSAPASRTQAPFAWPRHTAPFRVETISRFPGGSRISDRGETLQPSGVGWRRPRRTTASGVRRAPSVAAVSDAAGSTSAAQLTATATALGKGDGIHYHNDLSLPTVG